MLSGGLALLALLAIAAALTPNPSGRGTHRQLGLPPCTFNLLVGRPCPSCGMTTSWSYLMRGRPLRALEANVGGTSLALLSMAAAPWLIVSALRGRSWPERPNDVVLVAVSIAIAVTTLVQWAWRLA